MHPEILILTPVKNASLHMPRYVELLQRLDWPREKLSLGMLESDSSDGTWEALQALRPTFEARLNSVTLIKKDFGFSMSAGVPRWASAFQVARRTILARARNQLLFRALEDQHWVIWLDVDVVDYPPDIIQKMLEANVDIVHPHCVQHYGGKSFDRNAWSDHATRYMQDMRGTKLVRLDAVGGTMLMVKADIHRDGLIFPPFKYGAENPRIRPVHEVWGKGEIETEGFGIMATDMGRQCWGMPDLEILHSKS